MTRGLSLFEALISLMLLGFFALLSIGFLGGLGRDAGDVADRANARMIIATQRQALMTGVAFDLLTRDAIIQQLVEGVRPTGILRDRIIRISSLDEDAISRAAPFLALQKGGLLTFDPQAAQPAL